MKKSEALQQRKELLRLIKEWTYAEIMARVGRFDNLEYADYFRIKLEKEDELRKFIFGTSNLVELGTRWGLIREKHNRRKKKRRKKEDEEYEEPDDDYRSLGEEQAQHSFGIR